MRVRAGVVAIVAVATPLGPLHVAAHPAGLLAVTVAATDADADASVARRLRRLDRLDGAVGRAVAPERTAHRIAAEAVRQLEAYFAGRRRDFQLPLDLDGLAAWDRRVLEAVRCVPFGTVTSYGRLARAVGAPRAGRAVGGAVGRNPMAIVIPCHRVVSGDGSLGGYGGRWPDEREANLARKRALLTHEGVGLPPPSFFEPPPVAPPWSAGPT